MHTRHLLVLQAMEPISHNDTATGVDNQTNTRLFMRSAHMVNGKPARVPDISENALRSVLFREPLADHLIGVLAIERGTLPQAVMNLLYSGGNMGAGNRAPSNELALGHAVKRLYPSLDLLGGAVDCFILPRSRMRLAAWLVTREYADAIEHVAPQLADEARSISAFDLLLEETRTRGTGTEASGNQMLYTYETLAAGAKLVVEITLDAHTPPATAAAVGVALEAWDGYIGGQARQGRGRMKILSWQGPDTAPYMDHIAEHRAEMREGLITGRLGTGNVLCAA